MTLEECITYLKCVVEYDNEQSKIAKHILRYLLELQEIKSNNTKILRERDEDGQQ